MGLWFMDLVVDAGEELARKKWNLKRYFDSKRPEKAAGICTTLCYG